MRSVRLRSLVNSPITVTKIPAGSMGRVEGFTPAHRLAIESLMTGKAWQWEWLWLRQQGGGAASSHFNRP